MTNEHVTFNVEGMSGTGCPDVIHAALIRLNGVENVIVDVDLKRVAVEFDAERVPIDTLKGTIEDAGFKVR